MRKIRFIVRRDEGRRGSELGRQGYDNAIAIGDQHRLSDERLVALYHSPSERARQTAEGILRGYKDYHAGDMKRLCGRYMKISENLEELDPPNPDDIKDRDELLKYWFENHWEYPRSGKNQIFQYAKMYHSGRKVIDHLAYVLYAHRNEKDGSIIENITHSPNIESALVQLTGKKASLNSIRGCFKPGEGFTLDVAYSPVPTQKEMENRYIEPILRQIYSDWQGALLMLGASVSCRGIKKEVPLEEIIPITFHPAGIRVDTREAMHIMYDR